LTPGAVEDLEVGFAERRRELVLDDLTLTSLPISSSPRLIGFLRRMSSRTEL
jgi:hypothetical protein